MDDTIAIPTTRSYPATELAERTADIFHKNIIKRTPFVKDRVFEVYPPHRARDQMTPQLSSTKQYSATGPNFTNNLQIILQT